VALVANNFVIGKTEPAIQSPSSSEFPTIKAGKIVILKKPKVAPIMEKPKVLDKPKQPPRKSAYHHDMTTIHKI
jgi:hypothetical protein